MATKTKKETFTAADFKRATEHHRYLNPATGAAWVLSAAPDHWNKGENIVYIPNIQFRLAGEYKDVFAYIKKVSDAAARAENRALPTDDEIRNFIMTQAFTMQNREANATQIARLIEEQKAYDEAQKKEKKADAYSMAEIEAIFAAMKTFTPVEGPKKKEAVSRRRVPQTLWEQVQEVMVKNEGKNPLQKGSGYKIINVGKINDTGKVTKVTKRTDKKTGETIEKVTEESPRTQDYTPPPSGKMALIEVGGAYLPIAVNTTEADAAAQYKKALNVLERESGRDLSAYWSEFSNQKYGKAIVDMVSGQPAAQPVAQSIVQPTTPTLPPLGSPRSPRSPRAGVLPVMPTLPGQ